MQTLQLRSKRKIPILGQGTWRMGEKASQKQAEINALKLGIDLGMTLIDTAEMYGEDGAEKVVAEAISSCRDEVYLVSKFYPYNASYQGVIKACDRSLARLKIEWDLLPWCKDRNIPIMAYSPVEQKAFINHPQLKAIALQYNATPTQVALRWLLKQNNVIAIPKATNPNHIKENRAALDLNLTEADFKEIDHIFPPPNRQQTLAMR
jgi:diketogulonate reductase-like aldo/keto reductase